MSKYKLEKVRNMFHFLRFYIPHFWRLMDDMPYDEWHTMTFNIKLNQSSKTSLSRKDQ